MKTVILVCLGMLATGCGKWEEHDNNAKASSENGISNQQLQGKIGDAGWTLVRGFAYVSPTKSDRIVIGLYNGNGPTGCEVDSQSVWHRYENEESHAVDSVTMWIPRKAQIPSFPWRDIAPMVSISDFNNTGGGISLSAENALVEIREITDSQITGSLKASNGENQVDGSFTATLCANSLN